MSVQLHSTYEAEEICLEITQKNEAESVLQITTDEAGNLEISNVDVEADNEPTDFLISKQTSESDFKADNNAGSSSTVSRYNMKETYEISPFRQAVKGFVLNKLSKKVASSHLLSGITEKLVKKLEEGIEHSPTLTYNSAGNDKSRTIPQIKESVSESNQDTVPCELKSVVANDVLEVSTVEEAIECFEETKPIATGCNKSIHFKAKVPSRSLPSSPAHHLGLKAAEVDHSSDSEEKSSVSETLSSFNSNFFHNLELETQNLGTNAIELHDMTEERTKESNCFQSDTDPKPRQYLENAYLAKNNMEEESFSHFGYHDIFLKLKKIFISLPLSHLFLLVSIMIHNTNFLSMYYIDFIFDGLVIAYICYTLISIIIQTELQNISSQLLYCDAEIGLTTIDETEVSEIFQSTTKILKGEYDSEEGKNFPTDLVEICIQNHCLKISRVEKNQSKDSEEQLGPPYQVHDLFGAKVSIVPKGLIQRRIFRKRFPICVTLPSGSKEKSNALDENEDTNEEGKTDFISLVPYDDALLEVHKQKAIYLFALTDREKESLYWALKNSIVLAEEKTNIKNQNLCCCSPKTDVTSISYSSLLEINSDDPPAGTDDYLGKPLETKPIPTKPTSTVEFDSYMKTLLLNYKTIPSTIESNFATETEDSLNTAKGSDEKLERNFSVQWLNVVLGRLFYDFITQKDWSDYVMGKIQKKLDQIEMPSFVESLRVTDVFMGTSIPQVHAVSSPVIDNFGLWCDFDMTYIGSFHMTLKASLKIPKVPENSDIKQNMDGSGSSEDDDGGSSRSPKQSRLINKIEKWISHKHFQTVAQSRFVKKYVGDISNMPLTLNVEVHSLEGVLALNIPPIPTDRVWYGFRRDPTLSLTASPKVGSHEINLSAVVNMIEQKLIRAFRRAVVMPNMDDLMIPIMYTSVHPE